MRLQAILRAVGKGIIALAGIVLISCHKDEGPSGPSRSFMMGFSALPPRADTSLLIPTLTLSSQHSDAGLIQLSIPWDILLADTAAATEVRIVRLPLVNYYRGSGKKIVVALDVTDGLNRAQEDPVLISLGRSITDSMVQRLYREYVSAVDSILKPDYLSLAAETNLIRAVAPAPVYAAVVAMTNAAATHERALGTTARLMVSAQVETAWGKLQGTNVFEGIGQDRIDFPFIDALGLSSYPYLGGYAQPEDIPINYYDRMVTADPLPVMVLEGGWPSQAVGAVVTSPAVQARYIHRQAELLGATDAVGVFQITFTDLDPSIFPPGSTLPLFATLGLVDTALHAKPALLSWDSVLGRDLH
ncbi:MAG: hypothetical protein ABI679_16775 [Gemmatimonadota bacterium]